MSDSITFKYTLTEDDFVRAFRVSARSKRLWWIMWAVRFGALVGLYIFLSYIAGIPGYYALAGIFLLVAIYGVSFWWVWWIQPRRAARESPYLAVEVEGAVSIDGIAQRSALGKHETAWASYSTALESADYLLLYLGRNAFTPFPKRSFANQEDLNRFRALIRDHVPNFRAR
jgi:hypothetical protein